MPISVSCESCFSEFRVKDELAGKLIRCRSCSEPVRVPGGATARSSTPPRQAPVVDEMDNWDELEQPAAKAPAKSTAKKKRRPSSQSPNLGAWKEKLGSLKIAPAVIVGLGILLVGVRIFNRAARVLKNPGNGAAAGQFNPAGGPSGPIAAPQNGPGAAPVNPAAVERFPLASVPITHFVASPPVPSPRAPGMMSTITPEPSTGIGPGSTMTMRLHLPAGEHPPHSLPCILIAPAGSTLLVGMDLDPADHGDETAPYTQAGYAVLEYSIDGANSSADPQQFSGAYSAFVAAQAGVVNGRNALEYVLSSVPQVNPNRIFAAGHSSAAVLALLLAEHEPRIQGCLAYAAASDVEKRLKPNLEQLDVERVLPGIYAFLKQSSPTTHAAHLNCPVFLFHAADDNNEPVQTSRAFHAQLQSLSKQSTLIETASGGHYDSMIHEGIPAGLRWLQQLPGNR